MTVYKHILLATDLTKSMGNVLSSAKDMQETFSAKLSIVHVVDNLPPLVLETPAFAFGHNSISNFESYPYVAK